MAALAQWTSVDPAGSNVSELDLHVQQTNDRLQCIRQVRPIDGPAMVLNKLM
jgi:hypothetical protein